MSKKNRRKRIANKVRKQTEKNVIPRSDLVDSVIIGQAMVLQSLEKALINIGKVKSFFKKCLTKK